MVSFCGSMYGVNESSNYKLWLLVCGLWVVACLFFMLRFSIKWIMLKDYFPLKERSPMLCLLLLLFLTFQLILYPVQVIVNYFMSSNESENAFRVLYCAVKTIGSFIYVLRSLRIFYAFKVQDNMRSHSIFRFFKHEFYLVGVVVALFIVRLFPPILMPDAYPSPVSATTENSSVFFIRTLVEEFTWQLVLLICLWLQRSIRIEFGIMWEIGSIFALSLLTSLVEIVATVVYMLTPLGEGTSGSAFKDAINNFQCYQMQYPLNQIMVMVSSLVMVLASIVYPLSKRKQEHQLLPIQQVYDLENNLRAFLLEPQHFKVFYNFLRELQTRDSRKDEKARMPYTTLINFWAKLTKFKLQEDTDPTELIQFLRDLDTNIFGKNVVTSLNESFQQLNDDLQVSQREKVRNSINVALQELQDNVIGQLSTVYKDRFRKTRCFHYLKRAMQENDRINTNLLMLNMILREHSEL